MVDPFAIGANKSLELQPTYAGAAPDSEGAKQSSLSEAAYRPYAEESSLNETPYEHYEKKPVLPEPPYEPYKGCSDRSNIVEETHNAFSNGAKT